MAAQPDLARAVRGVIQAVDAALAEDDLSWLVATLDAIDKHRCVCIRRGTCVLLTNPLACA